MAPHLHHHHHQQQSSSSPASPKGQHYATTLDLARRLGLFDSKYPAQLKGGINRAGGEAAGQGIDWNELLRKFRKHNSNRNRKFTGCISPHRWLLRVLVRRSSGGEIGSRKLFPLCVKRVLVKWIQEALFMSIIISIPIKAVLFLSRKKKQIPTISFFL